MPYSKKRVEAEIRKRGSIEEASKALGRTVAQLRHSLVGTVKPRNSGDKKTSPGKSLADFRENYDKAYIVPRKIRAQLASMQSSWMYEVDFARAGGIPLQDLGAFRDQFAGFVVQLREGRRAWAGTKSLANQMRSML